MKLIKNFTFLTILIVSLSLCLVLRAWPDGYTHIIFCDVGQGDAILITHGFSQLLIDAGISEEASFCLDKHLPFWDRQLEVVLATHADADHIGGFAKIFENYQIKKVFLPQVGDESEVFTALRESVMQEKASLAFVGMANSGQNLVFSRGVTAQIVWPILPALSKNGAYLAWEAGDSETKLEDIFAILKERESEDLDKNDGSIVVLLQVGSIRVLLTGDLEATGEQSIISKGLIKRAQLLKAGHHGSKTSSSLEFLKRVQPEKVIISSGKNNDYGHPSPEVILRFEAMGAQILRTDQMGDIEIVSDGQKYWLAD